MAVPRTALAVLAGLLVVLTSCTPDRQAEPSATGSVATNAGTGPSASGSGDFLGQPLTDLPCTAAPPGGSLAPLGVALHELAAMAFDPWTESGLAGNDDVERSWLLEQEEGFVANESPESVPLWMWLESYESPPESAAAELCASFKRFGRLTGYYRSAAADDITLAGTPQMRVMVHMFQTEAGAEAFMGWVPTAPWVDGSAPEAENLSGAGPDAVLLTGDPKGGQVQVALVRHGRFVGEVTVSALTSDVDTGALGMKLHERIASVTPTGLPYDMVQVMTAPLRQADWAAIEENGRDYPDLTTSWLAAAPKRPPFGTYDAYELAQTSDEDWSSTMAGFGYLESATAMGRVGDEEFPTPGTELMVFGDESGAAKALQDAVETGLEGPGGQRFDVPGVQGATGVRQWTRGQDFIGYTWNVYFTHGPALARAFVAGGPTFDQGNVEDGVADVEAEADQDRNRQWAVDAAQAWALRLDRVLGAAATASIPEPGSPGPSAPDASGEASPASPDSGNAYPTVRRQPALIDTGGSSCALQPGGKAWCWGGKPTAVPGSHRFSQITSGGNHVCALDTTGKAWCWGSNGAGELGNGGGQATKVSAPAAVAGERSYVSISAQGPHTCALDTTGRAWCWGQLEGNMATEPIQRHATPEPVPGDHTFSVVATGNYHSCALDAAALAWCWGNDDLGQLGDGSSVGRFTAAPVAVADHHTFATISAGGSHTCALDKAGKAWCWGESTYGALGEGTAGAGPTKGTPAAVAGGHTFASITAGGMHTCALDTVGTAWCWGNDSNFGQLGDADSKLRTKFAPVQVAGRHMFTTIASGWGASCALDFDGRAWCWGDDQGGQLGQGKKGAPACMPETYSGPCSNKPLDVTGKLSFRTT